MRIVTLNANGIRAAHGKGFFSWLSRQSADFVCLQEIRAHREQLQDRAFWPRRYHCHYFEAHKKGYSGVALFARHQPEAIVERIGHPSLDEEARYLEFRYPGLSVVSLYLPSGTSGDERQALKMEYLDRFVEFVRPQLDGSREFVFCGDFNIAHKPIDLKNWRGNQKNSGFLPEERQWLDRLFGEVGLVDTFRAINSEPDQYTWWSNRGQAWAKNVGWRIDYQVATPGLARTAQAATIYTRKRFSDHAPLVMDYQFELPEPA
ncbi:MAG: exodeoxyribonuclease III [Gammaproteobacteria bacterium]|nr:exodeoxyribonuclease III [Gammaproteobacteria bacterium]